MFAILAVVAFLVAAIICFLPGVSVALTVVLGIIAIGLALLALHLIRPIQVHF